MTGKRIYSFGGGSAEGSASMKDLLGGKGANLAEMSSLGIPVPGGFTITTETCVDYMNLGEGKLPQGLMDEVRAALAGLEAVQGKKFGDSKDPLLVSVRSGARVSMPGMMDTVLNLGLNDATVEGLAAQADARFAWDSYRRFVQMYSDVVLGLHRTALEGFIDELKEARGYSVDTEVTSDDWKVLVAKMKAHVAKELGHAFPEDPVDQLEGAIRAVFDSWNTDRAVYYRKQNGIDDSWGTAVNVQAMVYGNMGETSATGVAFTRDPSTGDNVFFGEFLVNAQGEDVVAGIRTPQPVNRKGRDADSKLDTLQEVMPKAYAELEGIYERLEKHYTDMQDLEFTIEKGNLFLLQTRTGKRTGPAAVRIAIDMVHEGLISKETALLRVNDDHINQLLHPMVDPNADKTVLATGLPASPGAATGRVVFTAEEAVKQSDAGVDVILVREETSPEDIEGMTVARGILTQRGGQTSHAAVVARGMGRCCVAGCGGIRVGASSFVTVDGDKVEIKEGDVITLNGTTGEVLLGAVPTIEPDLAASGLEELLGWADEVSRMQVRANADTPHDATVARKFGATGIGLCRTEHMFFDAERILAVREMIIATSDDERELALDKLYPHQREDFVGIFTAMQGLPVTVRLLDPPLHEFLPHSADDIAEVAESLGVAAERVSEHVEALKEFNPMLGHRGCRLGITFPGIYRMQVRAIMDAALDVAEAGLEVLPEIMIPLVGQARELEILRAMTIEVVEEVFAARGKTIDYKVGTMIELPRACVTADEIAQHADFFSFGTNDLTQTTYGYSRDDAGFMADYLAPEVNVMKVDPFVSIDTAGVGGLLAMGVSKGRSVKANLKVGICGEHGGDPASIDFVNGVGLNYVSCSPYRVAIARLAAAQATLNAKLN